MSETKTNKIQMAREPHDLSARRLKKQCLHTLTSPASPEVRLRNSLNNLRRQKSILEHSDKVFTNGNRQKSVNKTAIARLQWMIREAEVALAQIKNDDSMVVKFPR